MNANDPASVFLSSLVDPDDEPNLTALLFECLPALMAELDAGELRPQVQSRWRRFERWCSTHDIDPYTCTESSVGTYLEEIGKIRRDRTGRICEVGRSGTLLWTALEAVGVFRRRAGAPDCSRSERLRDLCRVAGKMGPRRGPVPAAGFEVVRALLQRPDPRNIEVQTRALLVASHFGRIPIRQLTRLQRPDLLIEASQVEIRINGRMILLNAHPISELDPVDAFTALVDRLPDSQQLVFGAVGSSGIGVDPTDETLSWENEWSPRITIRVSGRINTAAARAGVSGWSLQGGAGVSRDESTIRRVSVWLSSELVDYYRDRALILGALHLRLRPGEAVALDTRRMQITPDGLLVDLARSKTNPDGARRETKGAIFHDELELCGVSAVLEWAELRDMAVGTPEHPNTAGGLLFAPSYPNDQHAISSGESMTQMINRRSREAGLDKLYSGYSLRRGAAHIMASKGSTEDEIRRALGHKSLSTQNTYRAGAGADLSREDLASLAQ